ncbi:MAG TPA: beta-ketoacyl-ACP synthase II [Anaerolineae bacterium]|nr:beta-ketoacyl-ACP synthase II [Anaerolineae bacterium]
MHRLPQPVIQPVMFDQLFEERFLPQPFAEMAFVTRPRRPRVVITGISVLSPIGNNVKEFWANALEGVSGIGPISRFDASPYPSRVAGEVRNFDPRDYMDFKEARRMARCSQFAIACVRMAAQDARIELPVQDRERVGVLMGTAVGGIDATEEGLHILIEKGWNRVSPFAIGAAMPNAPSFHMSMTTGALGYLGTITTACASGTQSIGEGAELIRRGWADVMFVGGTESGVFPVGVIAFCQMRALSTHYNDSTASRPFDATRDGFVMGEGCAVLVLESLEHAIARDAPIYAEVLGSSVASDAFDVVAPDPSGEGEVRVMKLALADAGIGIDEVDYISAHATSTVLGDNVEAKAIKKLFGERATQIPISAIKSMIGHTLGAGGAIEAVASVLTLCDQKIHPTINFKEPDPECIGLDLVPDTARRAHVETILSNSFGLGGQNACLVLRKVDM